MQKLLIFLLIGVALSVEEKKRRLIWSDEFDGYSIDRNKWGFEIGNGQGGWGNNELEYYTDRTTNAYLADSCLHIRAQREDMGGFRYTSARMKTQWKFNFQYGTVEARMKVPK